MTPQTNNSDSKLSERVKQAFESIGMTYDNLSPDWNQIQMMLQIETLETLKSMKQQEYDYWEAWKKAKIKENES